MKKFNPMKTRFRATFAADAFAQFGTPRFERIDEETETLYGVQITLEGEAKGHGVWLDADFCRAVADAGNATGDVGIKVRYGHPAMCSDAIGTELGRAKNFRVVDFKRKDENGEEKTCCGVVADISLLKSAHSAPQGDIAQHVLEVAKEDPTQFGQSIVFTYADFKSTDEEDNTILASEFEDFHDFQKAAGENKVFAVLGKLHGTDFTDTPAATDGIFSTGTLAEEAEQMLDEHPEIMEVFEKSPKSVVEFLERTGLGAKIESARLAGLQAAKDKEIAAIKAELADCATRGKEIIATLEAECKAKIEKLETDIGEKSTALETVKAELEQLKAKNAETVDALAQAQAALKAETERYRAQVGSALQQPTTDGSGWAAKYRQTKKSLGN